VGTSGAAAAATLEGFSESTAAAVLSFAVRGRTSREARAPVPALGSFSAQARASGPPLPASGAAAVADSCTKSP
jgi:hypothetical protein